ncbi:hypothetical protein [Kribbella sp. NPDC048915]|uniref:GNAT family N-acetyltransferase n=1 Tax=Kribbella sp. NPDC048915 TaxID=3155148 RepID=UPI0033E9F652
MTDIAIVPLTAPDWPGVEAIYAEGIATGHATFETAPPTWEAFAAAKLSDHRLIALNHDGTVVGWAAASRIGQEIALNRRPGR